MPFLRRPVMEGGNIDNDTPSGETGNIRERATALYTFLKEFTELSTKAVRTVDQYEHVLWFSDVPREPECDCAAWHRDRDVDGGETWLVIHKPRLLPAPEPPVEIRPWLLAEQLGDSSQDLIELQEEAMLAVRDDDGVEHLERQRIEDHPEVKSIWERYVEGDWWRWAEADRRAQRVQRVYTDLFSIYQKQQRLGEQYEVVLGLGLVSWLAPDDHEVRRHLIVAKTSLLFDAARGVMTVGPAGEGARAVIEEDMLDPTFRPDPDAQQELEVQLTRVGDQLWDPAPVDAILAAWVHSVSPEGAYREELSPPERALSDPRVHLAPALILRKRTDRSYLMAFEEIIRQLKEGAAIPPGVSRFITVVDDPDWGVEAGEESDVVRTADELYFPLQSNEEQRRIVERLGSHQGVLVQGPPGTGKSHTIVNLICHLLATGQRVLVTSHTARALRILQRFIRDRADEISPLAVVLLGDDRASLQAMEDSVQGITDRQNHWDSDTSQRRLCELDLQLDQARKEEAQALQELRSIRERETFEHPPRFGGYQGTLQAIAIRLRREREEEDLGWIQDRPGEAEEPPFSSEQFQDLRALLGDVHVEEWSSAGWNAVETDRIISPDRFSVLVGRESRARDAYRSAEKIRRRVDYSPLAGASHEARDRLAKEMVTLVEAIEQITRHRLEWVRPAVLDVLNGHDRNWTELLDTTKNHLAAVGDRARWADETSIAGLGGRDNRDVHADAEALLAHLEGGGRWGLGPFRADAVKRGWYLRREVRLAGRRCETQEAIKDLISWLDVAHHLRILCERWASVQRVVDRSFSEQVNDFKELCEPLLAVLDLRSLVARTRRAGQSIAGLSEPTWHDLDALRRLLETVAAVHEEEELEGAEAALEEAKEVLVSLVNREGADPAGSDLLRSFESRDESGYRDTFDRIASNEQTAATLARRERLVAELRGSAPFLAEELFSTSALGLWDSREPQFEDAWNWARASAWLERLADPDAEKQARFQLDSAGDRIRQRLKEIAAERAWGHCFARMTERERQHLVAWSKAVRSIGKGTGKYASIHRQNAREHMNECRTAIPAWVMPLYRVAESIKPGSDLFDVVIIDEASQSGPEALLLNYLAKKLVVVGDDKQISPSHVGINQADVNQLRARHIADIPHSDAYGVKQSFFDLAEIRYQGRIRLREHFRCMPEIIQFSNNLCYSSEPLIPLRQYGASRLSPVVSAHHVADGYLKGQGQNVSNPPEAQAIVDEIKRMYADPDYDGKTFGVISLLGHAQAREIETRLLEQLGPEEMERRQLVCGDAYAFQGDERDVMLLSLVSAPSESRRIGTLADEAAKRRFNVAASRARDQLLLFHSATLNDLSPQCLRYELLRYCQNPGVEQTEVSGIPLSELQRLAATADRALVRRPDPFGSWLEVDVYLQVAARRYRVLPQYEVAGYRIDLVVEGMDGRLAVECDGDEWHGSDRYDKDTARERMLERCGWKFWRVRGSSFAQDPQAALEDLWETLDRYGIYPEVRERPSESSPAAGQEAGSTATRRSHQAEADKPATQEHPAHHQSGLEATRATPTTRPSQPRLVNSGDLFRSEDFDGSVSESKETEPLPPTPARKSTAAASSQVDAPYRSSKFPSVLPDPSVTKPADLIPGLVEILSVEGPMSGQRLYRVLVKVSGRQRVGSQARAATNKAMARALRKEVIAERNEMGKAGYKERIFRKADTPAVVVRPRGDREFVEVPPSEVATVMTRLEQRTPSLTAKALYRAVLDFYDTKRTTGKIQQRLNFIYERRVDLSR